MDFQTEYELCEGFGIIVTSKKQNQSNSKNPFFKSHKCPHHMLCEHNLSQNCKPDLNNLSFSVAVL